MDKIEKELKLIISKERKKRMDSIEKRLAKLEKEIAKEKEKSTKKKVASYSKLNRGAYDR